MRDNFFEKNQNQFVANWILRKNDYRLILYIYIYIYLFYPFSIRP